MSVVGFSDHDWAELNKLINENHRCEGATLDIDYYYLIGTERGTRYRCRGCGEWFTAKRRSREALGEKVRRLLGMALPSLRQRQRSPRG